MFLVIGIKFFFLFLSSKHLIDAKKEETKIKDSPDNCAIFSSVSKGLVTREIRRVKK